MIRPICVYSAALLILALAVFAESQTTTPAVWTAPTPRLKASTPFAPKPIKGDNIFTGDAETWLADAILTVEMGHMVEISDQSVKDYVSAVGNNLVKYSREPTKKVQFIVLDDKWNSDSFSVGGGKIYITLAMLNELPNEDELAAVLGHELGHDIFHHAGLTVTRQLFWMKGKTSVKSAADTAEALTKLDEAYEKNSVAMVGEAFLGFQRAQELEADRAAFYNIYKAGYNPSAMKHFLSDDTKNFKKEAGSEYGLSVFFEFLFGSHPPSSQRAVAMSWESNFVDMPKKHSRCESPAFTAMKTQVATLVK